MEDFGLKTLKYQFLWDWDPEKKPVYETTLAELKNHKQTRRVALEENIACQNGQKTGGLKAGKWIGSG